MSGVRWRWQTLRTRLEIGAWRYGWLWGVNLALGLVVLLCQFVGLPQRHRENDLARQTLLSLQAEQVSKVQSPVAVLPTDNDPQQLAALTRIRVAESDVGEVLQRISAIASTQGMRLAQSEFQTSSEGHGGLRQVQVTLPLRATYPQLRGWIEAVLRQIPGVSIDQITLKRETVAQGQAEIRIKLSIWVAPHPLVPLQQPAPTVTSKTGGPT